MTDDKSIQADKGAVAVGFAYKSLIQIINQHHYHPGLSEDDAKQREYQYLRRISNDCGSLEWLSQMELEDGHSPVLQLDAVYTPQQVVEREHFEHAEELLAKHPDRVSRQLSAVELLNREQRLVLSGAAGSGKSALVNYLLLCMAGQALGKSTLNLKALTEPMPDDDGDAQKQPQPWDHGFLIPLRVILRDFATSKQFPKADESGDACHVLNFIEAELKGWGCEDYFPILKGRLTQGKVLLLFDGLDEVPLAHQRREKLIACIHGMVNSYSDAQCACRVLVTCRPYAYQQQHWQLARFADGTLAEFHNGQIRWFVERWYQQPLGLKQEQAEQRRKKFIDNVLQRESLRDLVRRPLLLSLCAYLHARQHELPDRRAELYQELLRLLVNKWEKARYQVKDKDDADKIAQYGLADFLNIKQDDLHRILKFLAFEAHSRQSDITGTADIPASLLISELEFVARIDTSKKELPGQLREYLRDRVGILNLRGTDDGPDAVYSFPHRSFQEYLAAAYFPVGGSRLYKLVRDSLPERIQLHPRRWWQWMAVLASRDPQRWREVALLLAAITVPKDPERARDLMEALIEQGDQSQFGQSARHWGLRLAAEILVENSDYLLEVADDTEESEWAELIAQLPELLTNSVLPAKERVATGRALARLGDPRAEVMEMDAMPFCLIPKGSFWMGAAESDNDAYDDEKPGAQYNLDYDFWLARYPVTVAQFRQFDEQSDYQPGDDDCLHGVSNEPVVLISWHDAMAFCEWLQARWQAEGWLPNDIRVTLPNEPEWEKAARGGEYIPETSLKTCISELGLTDLTDMVNQSKNLHPQRLYPWGETIDDEHCNFATRIGRVSTPGTFPAGRSPYGCEDLSGNIWEWTRSQFHDYPYPPVYSKDWWKRESADGSASRVLRGGSFSNSQRRACVVSLQLSFGRPPQHSRFSCVSVPI